MELVSWPPGWGCHVYFKLNNALSDKQLVCFFRTNSDLNTSKHTGPTEIINIINNRSQKNCNDFLYETKWVKINTQIKCIYK